MWRTLSTTAVHIVWRCRCWAAADFREQAEEGSLPMKLEEEELLFLPRRRCAANPSSVSLINTLLLLRCTSWEQGQEITGVLEWVSGTATIPGNRTEFIASLLIWLQSKLTPCVRATSARCIIALAAKRLWALFESWGRKQLPKALKAEVHKSIALTET